MNDLSIMKSERRGEVRVETDCFSFTCSAVTFSVIGAFWELARRTCACRRCSSPLRALPPGRSVLAERRGTAADESVNPGVKKDPRLAKMIDSKSMPLTSSALRRSTRVLLFWCRVRGMVRSAGIVVSQTAEQRPEKIKVTSCSKRTLSEKHYVQPVLT
jgi:hypothetical protein